MDKKCEICGQIFQVKPSHFNRRRVCGMGCAAKLRSQERKGKPQPQRRKKCVRCGVNPRRGRHLLLCDLCNDKIKKGTELIPLRCVKCEKIFYRPRKDVERGHNKFCSRECYRKSLLKSNNPNWKGGIKPLTRQLRDSLMMKKWIFEVLKKEGYKCFYCGCTGNLEAHHIINFSALLEAYEFDNGSLDFDGLLKFEPLWDVNNGVALCHKCHNKFPKVLPRSTIYVPEEFRERLLTNAIKVVASSVDDVVKRLGLQVKLTPLFAGEGK